MDLSPTPPSLLPALSTFLASCSTCCSRVWNCRLRCSNEPTPQLFHSVGATRRIYRVFCSRLGWIFFQSQGKDHEQRWSCNAPDLHANWLKIKPSRPIVSRVVFYAIGFGCPFDYYLRRTEKLVFTLYAPRGRE